MKAFLKTLLLPLLAVLTGISPLRAQWNTIEHDATINRGINDLFFIGSTGWAAGSRADAVSWGSRGLLYKTTDGGQTWNTISIPLTIGSDSVMSFKAIHFTNPLYGYVVATCYTTNGSSGLYYGAVFRTYNGGQSWGNCYSTKSQVNFATGYTTMFHHVFFNTTYNGVISASRQTGLNTYNGLSFVTNNAGSTWTQYTSLPGSQGNASFFESNGTGSMVGGTLITMGPNYSGQIARSTDNGMTWATTFTDNNYAYADIHFPASATGYAVGDSMFNTFAGGGKGKLVVTTNGGASWNALAYFPNFKPMTVYFASTTEGYIGGECAAGNSGILKTIDGGITWTPEVYPDVATNSLITSITFSTPATGYASNSWTSSNSVYGSFSVSCGVFLGPDMTYCQQPGFLSATPGTPGNDYVFSWSPGYGLTDSTIQNPGVLHAHNQQYIVTMTDTVTNCVATDTIIVSAYNAIVVPIITVCPGDSFLLDFGPGASFYNWQNFQDTDQVNHPLNINTQTMWVSEPGYYLGFATFPGCGSLTSWVGISDTNCVAFSCAVDAGNDTTFCQLHGQLNATPASPGNYTFLWSPAYGLDDPTLQNPTVTTGVDSMIYVVTMTDTANNCTATDTVIVNAYYFYIDTIYNCDSSLVTLDLGPGGSNYIWQFYTDPQGNVSVLNIPGQTLAVTLPGRYGAIALFPGCGALTSVITVIDSCNVYVPNVWPGDCNYDLTANMADALQIGLGYGATGATRPSATPLWYAQPMADWAQSFVNCNYKHADADGNGTIDVNDTLPISLNYGSTHPFRLAPQQVPASAPDLYLVANYDTVGLQTLVTVDIRLGTTTTPVDSIYGISFRITSDFGLIDTTLTAVNLGSTWLGTPGADMFNFRKEFTTAGVIDVAECGNNHTNRMNGNGSIGSLFIVTTDNLSGIATCHFTLSDITAVTATQHYLQFNTVSDSVVIDPSAPAGIVAEQTPVFSVYPNPANGNVTVQTATTATLIEVCDMTGRVVMTVQPTAATTTIETSGLAQGVYFLRVSNGKAVTTQKLTISH